MVFIFSFFLRVNVGLGIFEAHLNHHWYIFMLVHEHVDGEVDDLKKVKPIKQDHILKNKLSWLKQFDDKSLMI